MGEKKEKKEKKDKEKKEKKEEEKATVRSAPDGSDNHQYFQASLPPTFVTVAAMIQVCYSSFP